MHKEYNFDLDREVTHYSEKEAYVWAAGFDPAEANKGFAAFSLWGLQQKINESREDFAKKNGVKFRKGGVDPEGLTDTVKKILATIGATVSHAWLFESYVQEGPFPFVQSFVLNGGGWIEYNLHSRKYEYDDGKGNRRWFDDKGEPTVWLDHPPGNGGQESSATPCGSRCSFASCCTL